MGTVVAGIDLSGRTTGTTAIAWLEAHGGRPRVVDVAAGPKLRGDTGDAQIAARLQARQPQLVAIDAPLTLPHPLVCTKPDCPVCFADDGIAPFYGSRWLDRAEAWMAVGHGEKPPMPAVMIAGIAFRAMYLTRVLRRAEIAVIETWPMGVYRALARRLGTTGKETDDGWRRQLLATAVDGIELVDVGSSGQRRDRLDAVAAAYAAWCRLTETATAVRSERDPGEGAIWIPTM
jgi:predicted nuclease with RNAse H fold